MKKKLIIGSLLAVILAVGVVSGITIGNVKATNANEAQLREIGTLYSFRQQFGNIPSVQGRQTLDKVEVIYWSDNATLHAALLVGGIWLEVPREFINTGATQ